MFQEIRERESSSPKKTHKIGEYSSTNWRRESSCFLGSSEGRDQLWRKKRKENAGEDTASGIHTLSPQLLEVSSYTRADNWLAVSYPVLCICAAICYIMTTSEPRSRTEAAVASTRF